MKVALVYDRINKFGGAERVLLALHSIWPDAPVYTAVYDPQKARWADIFQIRTSFLQHIPLALRNHELFAWATPLAFELFSFDEFDTVISVTSAEAKNIITKPGTVHICYCLTPTRYLWSGYEEYMSRPGLGIYSRISTFFLRSMVSTLRRWDLIGSKRPDYYMSISELVGRRIKKYYQRNAGVLIYPPVDTSVFRITTEGLKAGVPSDYYLTVARMVGYKRIDLLITSFNLLGWPLLVIGSGRDKNRLKLMAGKNITFIDGDLTDPEMVYYYNHCRMLVYAGQEDFGLVALEALACGKPVICYSRSGMAEIIKKGKNGYKFDTQNVSGIVDALKKSAKIEYNSDYCRKSALRYDVKVFKQKFLEFVTGLMEKQL